MSTTVLIGLLLTAGIVFVLLYFPFLPVNYSQSSEARIGTDTALLNLSLDADVAHVYVLPENLEDKAVQVNVSAIGRGGLLTPDQLFQLAFQERRANNTLTVTSRVTSTEGFDSGSMNTICYVYVNPSLSLNLTVRTTTGQIVVDTGKSVIFQGMHLESTTGGIVVVWNETDVTGNVPISLNTTSGYINIGVTQSTKLSGNVTFNVDTASAGFVSLRLNIQDAVGARIETNKTSPGIHVEQKGFSGNEKLLQSTNYPSANNFLVNLKAVRGGIDINAVYETNGFRS